MPSIGILVRLKISFWAHVLLELLLWPSCVIEIDLIEPELPRETVSAADQPAAIDDSCGVSDEVCVSTDVSRTAEVASLFGGVFRVPNL